MKKPKKSLVEDTAEFFDEIDPRSPLAYESGVGCRERVIRVHTRTRGAVAKPFPRGISGLSII